MDVKNDNAYGNSNSHMKVFSFLFGRELVRASSDRPECNFLISLFPLTSSQSLKSSSYLVKPDWRNNRWWKVAMCIGNIKWQLATSIISHYRSCQPVVQWHFGRVQSPLTPIIAAARSMMFLKTVASRKGEMTSICNITQGKESLRW